MTRAAIAIVTITDCPPKPLKTNFADRTVSDEAQLANSNSARPGYSVQYSPQMKDFPT
jgi:hypothetical protein